MPNRSSNAGHVPQRTCVVCKKKVGKFQLLRFMLLGSDVIFDLNCELDSRGYYVCNDNNCLQKLDRKILKLVKSRRSNGR